jgi:OOP family OmpA-OmpF porin
MINRKTIASTVAILGLTASLAYAGPLDGIHDTTTGDELNATGSVYNQTLYDEYEDLADDLSSWTDVKDVELFNHKSVLAGHESPTDPEEVMDRNLSDSEQKTFGDALYRLRTAYWKGSKELAPSESAIAQVSYDCWIEAVEDDKRRRAEDCQNRFEDAMAKAEAAANKNIVMITISPPLPDIDLAQRPEPIQAEPIPQAVLDQYFLIPFEFDSTSMASNGSQILQDAIATLAQYPTLRVNLIAHADSSGNNSYNQKLSQRRADSVLTRMLQSGVDGGRVDVVEAVGETRLLVQTGDGVADQRNRVVELDLKQ